MAPARRAPAPCYLPRRPLDNGPPEWRSRRTRLCRFCKNKVWDIFYIVTNDAAQIVKFGVTSHDPRARLRFHQAGGFATVLKMITRLPDAAELEYAALATLRLAGIPPVRGREYFDMTALPVILDVADNWPGARAT